MKIILTKNTIVRVAGEAVPVKPNDIVDVDKGQAELLVGLKKAEYYSQPEKLNQGQLIAAIGKAATIEQLEGLMADGEKRKKVIDAYRAKELELKPGVIAGIVSGLKRLVGAGGAEASAAKDTLEVIEIIANAESVDDINTLVAGDDRQGIQEAAAARIAELTA